MLPLVSTALQEEDAGNTDANQTGRFRDLVESNEAIFLILCFPHEGGFGDGASEVRDVTGALSSEWGGDFHFRSRGEIDSDNLTFDFSQPKCEGCGGVGGLLGDNDAFLFEGILVVGNNGRNGALGGDAHTADHVLEEDDVLIRVHRSGAGADAKSGAEVIA